MATARGYISSILHPAHYVTTSPTAPPMLAEMAGRFGRVEKVVTEVPFGSSRRENTWYEVKFIVTDGTFPEHVRTFHAEKSDFVDVPQANVPPDVLAMFERHQQAPVQTLATADKAEVAAYKKRQKHAAGVQAVLDKFFDESNTFWKNWKGPGPIPRSDKDPADVDATNRKAPKII